MLFVVSRWRWLIPSMLLRQGAKGGRRVLMIAERIRREQIVEQVRTAIDRCWLKTDVLRMGTTVGFPCQRGQCRDCWWWMMSAWRAQIGDRWRWTVERIGEQWRREISVRRWRTVTRWKLRILNRCTNKIDIALFSCATDFLPDLINWENLDHLPKVMHCLEQVSVDGE